ncbi:SIR2 family protein [Vibrio aestuarianus]|uniref:DUF4917 family protein n=1 Tax=Vibrio aestuarianus TaxID=28171 RepID=A0A9X4IUI9_9VIBR|nr:SIR2 family protein [Vibrio aestuarianus]MDE1244183.1 DUF4917 family protein [Vibrio aestuarianus]
MSKIKTQDIYGKSVFIVEEHSCVLDIWKCLSKKEPEIPYLISLSRLSGGLAQPSLITAQTNTYPHEAKDGVSFNSYIYSALISGYFSHAFLLGGEGFCLEDELLKLNFDEIFYTNSNRNLSCEDYLLHIDLSLFTHELSLTPTYPNLLINLIKSSKYITISENKTTGHDKDRTQEEYLNTILGQIHCACSCRGNVKNISKMIFPPTGYRKVTLPLDFKFGDFMTRKLLIFGNGLGMALDQNHFSLAAALEEIWNRDGFLTEEQKRLIERCLGRGGAPEGEYELDTLHQAITHCKALNRIGGGDVHWLNQEGQEFPEITATYIHKVATRLHNYNGELPQLFEERLVQFIKDSRSHVATLNYDKLLYSAFIDNNIFNGYRGYLVDGMLDQGFSSDALERRFGNRFGYYLHLHGSPLFVNRNNEVCKLPRQNLTVERNESSEHIVLTHVKHKTSVIAASHALSTYWDYLQFALSEAEEVILFGYSGFDKHLNILLRPYLSSKRVRVVEWEGADEQDARERYWRNELGHVNEVIRLENITAFTDW